MSSFKKQVLPYAIVVLFGFIGFSLPLPMLPEMFLDPERSIFSDSLSIETKTFLLGLLMASYPLGQLFGSPLFGRLSDKYGRKKTILCTLCGTGLGYVITAISTSHTFYFGIFLGLSVCGFFEGNVAIAQSVIADLTSKDKREHKSFHFGLINLFISLGFIVGPFIGGQMSDPTLVSWFSFSTPFWIAALMSALSILMIYFLAEETRLAKPLPKEKFWPSFFRTFQMPSLKRLYVANFFLALGFYSYFRFLPVYLERLYDFSSSQLAYVMIFSSVMMTLGILVFNKPISKRSSPIKTTAFFSLFLALMLVVLVIPNTPWSLLATIPPIGVLLAIAITNGNVIISDAASEDLQGAAMGALTSMQVLAEVITGVMGGALAASMPSLPLLIGALMAAICSMVLLNSLKKVS